MRIARGHKMSDEISWNIPKRKHNNPGLKSEALEPVNLNHWIKNPNFKQKLL